MAVLPSPYGNRVTPQFSRPVAQIDSQGARAVGASVQRLAGTVQDFALTVQDREDTSAAKERDAYVSDEIRKILHDPEAGFTNMYGKDAVAARNGALDRLKALGEAAVRDMSPGAVRKLEARLASRIDGAEQTIDTHTGSQRNVWMNGASQARIEAAEQDSLVGGLDITPAFNIIAEELTQKADREGWDAAQLDLELSKAKSSLVSNQAVQLSSSDPEFALEYIEKNKDSMQPGDYLKLKSDLEPVAKQYKGKRIAREAFGSLGDMSVAMRVAADNLGMNESDKSGALKEYLKDGGVNLDPAEIAWCAAYVNATLAQSGMSGTGSNMARSFLNWGVKVSEPKRGDLVVLSRGSDQTKGHVGFFDGYDEAGNIRILGGNQGNSVSVATYSKESVLGYRRAQPQTVTADDAGAKLAEIMQIEDPAVRKGALDEFNLFMKSAEGQRKRQLDAASDTAFRYIESGSNPDDLPLDVRRELGMESMSKLRTYHGKLQAGETPETDPEAYLELKLMQGHDFCPLKIYQAM